jgi:hypothetical protein
MKTFVELWQYIAGLFLEWEMFQTEVKKSKHFIFRNISPKILSFTR